MTPHQVVAFATTILQKQIMFPLYVFISFSKLKANAKVFFITKLFFYFFFREAIIVSYHLFLFSFVFPFFQKVALGNQVSFSFLSFVGDCFCWSVSSFFFPRFSSHRCCFWYHNFAISWSDEFRRGLFCTERQKLLEDVSFSFSVFDSD